MASFHSWSPFRPCFLLFFVYSAESFSKSSLHLTLLLRSLWLVVMGIDSAGWMWRVVGGMSNIICTFIFFVNIKKQQPLITWQQNTKSCLFLLYGVYFFCRGAFAFPSSAMVWSETDETGRGWERETGRGVDWSAKEIGERTQEHKNRTAQYVWKT